MEKARVRYGTLSDGLDWLGCEGGSRKAEAETSGMRVGIAEYTARTFV